MYSLNTSKGNVATNVAIPALAAGGWQGFTLRRMAEYANITPQAVAAWFPTVAAMRTSVGVHYGERWIVHLRDRIAWYHPRSARDRRVQTVADLAIAALPRTELQEEYDRIWLTVIEAAKWDEKLGQAVSEIEAREQEHVEDLIIQHGGHEVRDAETMARVELAGAAVVTMMRGVRAARCATHEPMTTERAEEVLRVVLDSVTVLGPREVPVSGEER